MTNIYTLTGKYYEAQTRAEELQQQLDEIYTENGGEVTEETEGIEAVKAELDELAKEIRADVMSNSDAWAECYLNAKANAAVAEAALKAFKEQIKEAESAYLAQIARSERRAEWWKANIEGAMVFNEVEKIGGARTNLRHSAYYTSTKAVNIDENAFYSPFDAIIQEMRERLPEYIKVSYTADKNAIKKAEELPQGVAIETRKTLIIK